MALQKTMTVAGSTSASADGFSVNVNFSETDTFYIKVERVFSTKSLANFEVSMKGNKVSGSRDYEFEPDLDGPNFIKQAYEHLKTLPEFAGAADV